MARQNGELVGFLAVDVDDELDRSYLFGPFVNHQSVVSPSRPRHEHWDEVANRLVSECLAIIPDNATAQIEMFFDRSNDNISKLGHSLGFRTYKDVRTFRFDRSGFDKIERGTASPAEARHHPSLVELHDRTFPNTHLPGTRMIEGLGQYKACFVRAESDEVVGYIYLEVDDTTGSASLEFLGTAERARGRGIGADLVRTGLSLDVRVRFGERDVARGR